VTDSSRTTTTASGSLGDLHGEMRLAHPARSDDGDETFRLDEPVDGVARRRVRRAVVPTTVAWPP
jgi:hypothetical protein